MGLVEVRNEIQTEKSLEMWARRCSNHFTKKVKMLYEEIDNMIWSGSEREITKWCLTNKVYDEITEDEIEEIWQRGPRRRRTSSVEREMCLGDGEKGVQLHQRTRGPHPHHLVQRIPRGDAESDEGHQRSQQYREEAKANS